MKLIDTFWGAWSLFLDGVDKTAVTISLYPKTTLLAFIGVVAIAVLR